MESSREEVEARHRKELKALDGETRAALKKAKGTAGGKGKKAKEVVAAVEAEFSQKLAEMKARHETELAAFSAAVDEETNAAEDAVEVPDGNAPEAEQELEQQQHKKAEKARLKRAKAREQERAREQEILEETANAGPLPRDVENDVIHSQLLPLHLAIQEVTADGHCLYRAVAAQCYATNDDEKGGGSGGADDYLQMRRLCADTLLQHQDDFAPFCEYSDDVPDFACYTERVRSSADWGGHLELRALSLALQRPIWVYSAATATSQSKEPLVIHGDNISENGNDQNPIRLSYHLDYYALGEHYNQVVRLSE